MLYIDYPKWITPEIFSIPFLRWYGLMYVIAFSTAYFFLNIQIKNSKIIDKKEKELMGDMFFTAILCLVLFARFAFVFIYDKSGFFLRNPHRIIWPFDSDFNYVGIQGMSYHGGVFGAALGGVTFMIIKKMRVLYWADCIVISIPFGYTFGRIGNFINSELYGRITASPIGILFENAEPVPTSDSAVKEIAEKLDIDISTQLLVNLPRHPSQLYEAFFEGIILGLIMWFMVRKRKNKFINFDGFGLSFFLFAHGVIRFVIEYFRMPDVEVGFVINGDKNIDSIYKVGSILNISMGQILSLIMSLIGILCFIVFKIIYNKQRGEMVEIIKIKKKRK